MERTLKFVTESLSAFVSYVGPDERYRYVNAAYERWFGLKREDIIGRPLSEILQPAHYAVAHAKFIRAMDGEKTHYEAELKRPDGPTIWLEVEFNPDIDGVTGEIRGVVIQGVEVTHRKLSEAAVRASESRFRTLFEQSPFPIQLFSPDGRTVAVNQAWKKLWGFSDATVRDEILPHYNVLEDSQLVAHGIADAIRRGFAGESVEIPVVRYDPVERGFEGQARWVGGRMHPILNANGEVEEVVLTHLDVTESRAADEEKQKLVALIESSSDFIGLADLEENVLYVNAAGREMVGMDGPHAPIQTRIADYFNPDEYRRVSNFVFPQIFRSGRWEGEVDFLHRETGKSIPTWMNCFGVKDASGKVVAIANVSRDMSDLKAVQENLERAVRARDEFISICSHELKTPITSLKLQYQIAQRRDDAGDVSVFTPESSRRRVAIVNRQLDRMVRLIDEMLNVTRLSRGPLELNLEVLDFSRIAESTVANFEEQFVASGIPIQFTWEAGIDVRVDEYRMEQVVANLLTNALKYGQGRPVEVRVFRAEDSAVLTVTDHGMGIAAEDLGRIFDRYERAISSSDVSGLGLGLYISRKIVTAHGGRISASSVVGSGSEFRVELPMAPGASFVKK